MLSAPGLRLVLCCRHRGRRRRFSVPPSSTPRLTCENRCIISCEATQACTALHITYSPCLPGCVSRGWEAAKPLKQPLSSSPNCPFWPGSRSLVHLWALLETWWCAAAQVGRAGAGEETQYGGQRHSTWVPYAALPPTDCYDQKAWLLSLWAALFSPLPWPLRQAWGSGEGAGKTARLGAPAEQKPGEACAGTCLRTLRWTIRPALAPTPSVALKDTLKEF